MVARRICRESSCRDECTWLPGRRVRSAAVRSARWRCGRAAKTGEPGQRGQHVLRRDHHQDASCRLFVAGDQPQRCFDFCSCVGAGELIVAAGRGMGGHAACSVTVQRVVNRAR